MENTTRCNRCVMDNLADPTITYDSDGYCNYCSDAYRSKDKVYFPNELGKEKLDVFFSQLKSKRKKEKYDCMLGLSGGLDSSYAAYLGHSYGLRMLAVHIDDGFNTTVTTENIKKICDAYSIDLIIEKPNPILFCDVTKAFLRAGVPNIAIPQDNVYFASLYSYAKNNKIDCFLNGGNFALESILQRGNSHDASDKKHILSIWKLFGENFDPTGLPLFSVFEKRFYYQYLHKITFYRPLNFINYNAQEALKTLKETCDFEDYGDKHCESIFTKFMQRYYLPTKFGVDKRKSHYSSMILSGQMTRDEAIKKLDEPLYGNEDFEIDLSFILDKLDMGKEEFEKIMNEKPRKHADYPTSRFNTMAREMLKIRKLIFKY